MKISLEPFEYKVSSNKGYPFCSVKVSDEEVRSAMEDLDTEDVAKWSMAIGGYSYEPGYPSEFIIELSRRLLPELKSILKDGGENKELIDCVNRLIKYVKEK